MNSITPPQDFWSRQANAQTHALTFGAVGTPVTITANSPTILPAAQISAHRFSQHTASAAQAMHIRFIERANGEGPSPANWPEQLQFAGTGDWLSLSLSEWAYGTGHRQTQEALVVLNAALSHEAMLISRYFIDHYILNFLFNDWAMLHASCVLDAARQKLIAFIGTHNIGKSTAALQLLRAGWHFLADGMLLVRPTASPTQFEIGGYPIGEVKLRDDVLALFPEYTGERVHVREQSKTVVNLRALHPERVVEETLVPHEIHLCFTERSANGQTSLTPITVEAARECAAQNTVFWDEAPNLKRNSETLHALLAAAHLHHLHLGTHIAELLMILESL